jgi:hypothetical protein
MAYSQGNWRAEANLARLRRWSMFIIPSINVKPSIQH